MEAGDSPTLSSAYAMQAVAHMKAGSAIAASHAAVENLRLACAAGGFRFSPYCLSVLGDLAMRDAQPRCSGLRRLYPGASSRIAVDCIVAVLAQARVQSRAGLTCLALRRMSASHWKPDRTVDTPPLQRHAV